MLLFDYERGTELEQFLPPVVASDRRGDVPPTA
jgi:hypothetical protein